MRELRVQHQGEPYRVLYAFDPRRTAILLIGGNKTGDDRWYDTFVPIADRLYDEHIASNPQGSGKRGEEHMTKRFAELESKMSREAIERSDKKANILRGEMALNELRAAMEITQEHLAKFLRVNQAAVSKMERRTDMYVSTLSDFIRAMGGQLEINARFPEGTVRIRQFRDLKRKKTAPAGVQKGL